MLEYKEKIINTTVALKDPSYGTMIGANRKKSHFHDYFGLTRNPFRLTPDPKFLYLSSKHKEALAHLYFGLQEKNGFIAITGEVGTGKTTLCRAFLDQLTPEYEVAYIFNPCLTSLELLQNINGEFGITFTNENSKKALTDSLYEFLIEKKKQEKTVIVIIDEAQELAREVLEQIRLISNLETNTEKLIQIILIGQPELNEILHSHNLRQLNQRITVRWNIDPLNDKETNEYINNRLRIAGSSNMSLRFNNMAIGKIYHYSKGIPRVINVIAHMAMLIAYVDNKKVIDKGIITRAVKELDYKMPRPSIKTKNNAFPKLLLGGLLCLLIIALGYSSFSVHQEEPPLMNTKTREDKSPFDQLKTILGKLSEKESYYLSRLQIINIWGIDTFDKHLISVNLLSYELTGDMKDIKRFNLPCILEVTLFEDAKRYIPIYRIEGEYAVVFMQRELKIPLRDIDSIWNGKGWIYWKNFENLYTNLMPGDKGVEIKWLQLNLKEMGFMKASVTSVFDRDTLKAVRNFQKAIGLNVDGVVGPETKILLYNRLSDVYQTPKLIREKAG